MTLHHVLPEIEVRNSGPGDKRRKARIPSLGGPAANRKFSDHFVACAIWLALDVGTSQAAEICGVDRRTISAWKVGHSRPHVSTPREPDQAFWDELRGIATNYQIR